MTAFNIYLSGVGGQGIGMLSEILLRAGDLAGFRVKGVDTHGLAQRGGVVVSHLRMGSGVHSPLVPAGRADLVVSLERFEALRAMNSALKDGGTLIYYDASWQPLNVRINKSPATGPNDINAAAVSRGIQVFQIYDPGLLDARMQNIVLLASIAKNKLVPGVKLDHFQLAMGDLMAGNMLAKNKALLLKHSTGQ